MSLSNMPMFELFPPIFKSKKIEQWTANEFWKHLKLSKKERNRFNRQRMYRLLRKLVEDGFLTKETNLVNPRFSTFSETSKLDQLRELNSSSRDLMQMKNSQKETRDSIALLEKQLQSFNLLEKNFPNSINKINIQKNKCIDQLANLHAYNAALNSVLTSN